MPAPRIGGAVEREIRRLTLEGKTQRAIACQLRVSPSTVRRVQSTMELPACACGQPYGHKGWCEPRKAASPKYQAAVARMPQLPQNQRGSVRPPFSEAHRRKISRALRRAKKGKPTHPRFRAPKTFKKLRPDPAVLRELLPELSEWLGTVRKRQG